MKNQEKPTNPKDVIGQTKVNLAYVPPGALVLIAQCMEDGAGKYGPYNWREADKKVGHMNYLSAALRHILAYIDGQDTATDSQHDHLAHVCSGLMVLLDARLNNNAIDDRPRPGAAGTLLDNLIKKPTHEKKT